MLDVAVGDGNAAVLAVRRGATVTGIDLTAAQIERARARCLAEGADVDLRVGDAQALDLPDAAFDVVLSVMGVIFAPDHERAAAELARVVRPGGTVAMTSWFAEGWSARWRARVAGLVPPPPAGTPSPDEWGDPAEVERRLRAAGLEVEVSVRPFDWRFPSEASALETFLAAAGPYVAFMEQAAAVGKADEARAALVEVLHDANTATDGTCRLNAPYVLAISSVRGAHR